MLQINGYTIVAAREAYGGYVILGAAEVHGEPGRYSYVVATIPTLYHDSWSSGDYFDSHSSRNFSHAANRYAVR